MTALSFVVAALAAYRVSYMIVIEEGPLGIFEWVRSRVDPFQKTWIGRGLNCVLCVSFWVALPFTLLCGGGWLEWPAVAGAALVLHRVVVNENHINRY